MEKSHAERRKRYFIIPDKMLKQYIDTIPKDRVQSLPHICLCHTNTETKLETKIKFSSKKKA